MVKFQQNKSHYYSTSSVMKISTGLHHLEAKDYSGRLRLIYGGTEEKYECGELPCAAEIWKKAEVFIVG